MLKFRGLSISEWNAGFAVGVRLLLGCHHPEIKVTANANCCANTANAANEAQQDIKFAVAVSI